MDALTNLETLAPFILLLAAVLGLWVHRAVWITALVAAVALGYHSGALVDLAALWMLIAAALAWSYARVRARASTPAGKILRIALGLLFFVYALAMALALLPGFIRVELTPPQVLSVGAAPYALAVGFPKVVAGILILGLINPVLSASGIGRTLKSALPVFVITTLAVMICALALGYTRFDPHWAPLFLIWAPINLFFTCLAEEAFFRGFVQHEVSRAGDDGALWGTLALILGALLFGLAHFAGGPSYVIAGVIAGLGYGWAFLRTRRIEAAMAVHFGLNAVHFLLFAYPRIL